MIQNVINEEIISRFQEFGLAEVKFLLTDFARVRTYRLIMGNMEKWNAHSLRTDTEDEV